MMNLPTHRSPNTATLEARSDAAWYRTLSRVQWNTLVASNLGWLFDGFETYALILTVGPALRQLLEPALHPEIPAYAGTIIAINLLGWGIGGMIGGVLADYLGRRRMMMIAVLAYSLTTGLSAFSFNWLFIRDSAFSRRGCGRIRMGDGLLDDRRALARSRARQGRRPDAVRPRHWLLHRLARCGCSSARSGRVPGATCTCLASCRRC